jgi:hypothetical protein
LKFKEKLFIVAFVFFFCSCSRRWVAFGWLRLLFVQNKQETRANAAFKR